MTITTLSTASHITPTVIQTFFQHYYRQARKSKEDRHLEATDEFLFDQAFHIVKRFIGLGTNDTVESLQAFTNTRIPGQPFSTTIRVLIPLHSCDQAARALIDYFGPEDLKNIVGGETWWQVRSEGTGAGAIAGGVEGEWIAMTSDWKKAKIIDDLPDGEARVRAAKYAKYNKRHERKKGDAARRGSVASKGEASTTSDSKLSTTADTAASKSSSTNGHRDQSTTVDDEEEEEDATAEDGRNGLDNGDEEQQETIDKDDLDDPVAIEELDRLRRVMLYCHGGGYYFGSINTHRYQIVRLARKMGGRAFCPNYRKAPGYPWPCPLQDCLAAWFYLTQPPPRAPHKPISPRNIILAGDSAGGGMCLALLGVLRDLGQEMPAGAVLISPWCDMTHSFDSILQNTETDIIPPYGFVHKPSTLWPVPANIGDEEQTSDGPDRHVPTGVHDDRNKSGATASPHDPQQASNTKQSKGKSTQEQSAAPNIVRGSSSSSGKKAADENTSAARESRDKRRQKKRSASLSVPQAPQPLPSEDVSIKLSTSDDPICLKQQIQLYATNSQLYHPLCSPVLQGSLGGLPPLYILAGEGEVLRDEIILLAHRAARPAEYALPEHLLAKNSRARETAQKWDGVPTKVHLQVFDDQCHVLTLFSFTTAARYAFRAIASFAKFVTRAETVEVGSKDEDSSASNGKTVGRGQDESPFPELAPEASGSSSVFSPKPEDARQDGREQYMPDGMPRSETPQEISRANTPAPSLSQEESGSRLSKLNTDSSSTSNIKPLVDSPQAAATPSPATRSSSGTEATTSSPLTPASSNSGAADSTGTPAEKASKLGGLAPLSQANTRSSRGDSLSKSSSSGAPAAAAEPTTSSRSSTKETARSRRATHLAAARHKVSLGVDNAYSGQVPLIRPSYTSHMIRERVSVRGDVRPLEPEGELQSIRMYLDHPEGIGAIKEGPVQRYLEGQGIWDKRFKREAKRVEKRRRANEKRGEELLRGAVQVGLIDRDGRVLKGESAHTSEQDEHPRYTPLDVIRLGETPPPSALSGRRDCDEAIVLLRSSLHRLAKEAGLLQGSQGRRDGTSHRYHPHHRTLSKTGKAKLALDRMLKGDKAASRPLEQLLGDNDDVSPVHTSGTNTPVTADEAAAIREEEQGVGMPNSKAEDVPSTATTLGGGPSSRVKARRSHSRRSHRERDDTRDRRRGKGRRTDDETNRGNFHAMNLWVRSMGLFGKKTREKAYFEKEEEGLEEEEAIGRREGETTRTEDVGPSGGRTSTSALASRKQVSEEEGKDEERRMEASATTTSTTA